MYLKKKKIQGNTNGVCIVLINVILAKCSFFNVSFCFHCKFQFMCENA